MTDTEPCKPPPIVVGVQGFVATRSAIDETPAAPAIDWARLLELPAFSMFLAERGEPAQQTLDFYALYCQWHEAKGYWPNETPMGVLKGNGR